MFRLLLEAAKGQEASIMTAFDRAWDITKYGPGGFRGDECQLCGVKLNDDNPGYESPKGNSFCKGCYSQRWRVE